MVVATIAKDYICLCLLWREFPADLSASDTHIFKARQDLSSYRPGKTALYFPPDHQSVWMIDDSSDADGSAPVTAILEALVRLLVAVVAEAPLLIRLPPKLQPALILLPATDQLDVECCKMP